VKGPVRWILLLVLIGVVVAVVVVVPFGGRTLLDRLTGDPAPPAPRKPAPVTQGESSGDHLTAEDRKGLDDLIESKLEHKPAVEGEQKK
jgi:hypothetical protein